jgi:hypothetical protein
MLFGTQSDDAPPVNNAAALEAIDSLYHLEMQSNLLYLRHQRRRERVRKSLSEWAAYWPMALGILLSCFTPQLREFLEQYRPWGMWIGFPMVSLALRPEVYLGSKMAALLPTALMYAQFPLEGLLAKVALKGTVTPYGVAMQVLYFHGLCVMELWLVSGGLQHLLHP